MGLFNKETADAEGVGVGSEVFTSDGHSLGRIKEMSEGGFLVDVSLGKDYWLGGRDIDSVDERGVVLVFAHAELEEYKREEPPPEDVVEGIPFTTAALISDEEQAQMRERMERELAEQRRKLHEN
jgi:hypothetical protein